MCKFELEGTKKIARCGPQDMIVICMWYERGLYHVRGRDYLHDDDLDHQTFAKRRDAKACFHAWRRRWR